MGTSLTESGLGMGVYSVADASRLTGIPTRRVKRWIAGYEFRTTTGRRQSGPLVMRDYRRDDGVAQLSFRDLMELRFVDAFLEYGVGWKELRRSAKRASEQLGATHPFSTLGFRTDGHSLFAQCVDESGDKHIWQLRDNQSVFTRVIEPLLKGVEIRGSEMLRWWPLGNQAKVVIDPRRNFGRPVGQTSGIPSFVLAAYATSHSIRDAADWFEVDRSEVRDCIRFEHRMAA